MLNRENGFDFLLCPASSSLLWHWHRTYFSEARAMMLTLTGCRIFPLRGFLPHADHQEEAGSLVPHLQEGSARGQPVPLRQGIFVGREGSGRLVFQRLSRHVSPSQSQRSHQVIYILVHNRLLSILLLLPLPLPLLVLLLSEQSYLHVFISSIAVIYGSMSNLTKNCN